MLSIGLVGVNTYHAEAFTRIFNGSPDAFAAIDEARITHVWPGDPGERLAELESMLGVYDNRIEDLSAMIDQIDGVLIVDDTGGGARHADLARPFLEAGIPTFIDKPMTTIYADAVALFDLAEKHGTPLTSSSALRYPVELEAARPAINSCGKLSSILAVGPEEWFYYGVHVVELPGALTTDRPVSVHRHAFAKKDIAIIEYDSGLVATVQTLRDAGYLFHCSVFGEDGHTSFDVKDAMGFYTNEMRAFVRMIETGQPPLTREQTLDVMAILHAGNRSADIGERVLISEITGVQADAR